MKHVPLPALGSRHQEEEIMLNDATIPARSVEGRRPVSLARRIARHAPTVARILFGLMFFVFGLNGFLNFIPPPSTPMPERAVAFGMALMQTGYMFPLIKGTEVLAGLLLLSNRFVPLALLLLAPVVVNIVAFHAFLAPDGIVIAGVHAALVAYVAWAHRRSFAPLLAARALPA
jgi:uncharacterized membrane protein YphA (DoxX/SURF4 family)